MIYLDNAATTFPKPRAVYGAVNSAIQNYGANPGRSGHKMSLKAAELVYNCRETAANFYNAPNVENIIFTPNCTYALNTVIMGFLKAGDNAVVSNLEHNSVLRPLELLKSRGVSYTVAEVVHGDFDATVDNFRNAINHNTKLFVITHASNVTGTILPVSRLTALAHQYGIKVLIDTAQTSGVLPIDAQELNIDFLAAPGHKGLMGPMGTGILYIKEPESLSPLVCGGTGSSSLDLKQPEALPDRFESGTCNLPGICGLKKGIDFVNSVSIKKIQSHEYSLLVSLYDKLSRINGVVLYTPKPSAEYNAPLISFNVDGKSSEETADILNRRYSIAVRAGLHCAPLTHKMLGTEETGAVRASMSYFNNSNDIAALANAIKNISYFENKKFK